MLSVDFLDARTRAEPRASFDFSNGEGGDDSQLGLFVDGVLAREFTLKRGDEGLSRLFLNQPWGGRVLVVLNGLAYLVAPTGVWGPREATLEFATGIVQGDLAALCNSVECLVLAPDGFQLIPMRAEARGFLGLAGRDSIMDDLDEAIEVSPTQVTLRGMKGGELEQVATVPLGEWRPYEFASF